MYIFCQFSASLKIGLGNTWKPWYYWYGTYLYKKEVFVPLFLWCFYWLFNTQ